jgi:hypothetical protein
MLSGFLLLDQLTEAACQILVRDLTEEEWEAYLPNLPYRPTCAGVGAQAQ